MHSHATEVVAKTGFESGAQCRRNGLTAPTLGRELIGDALRQHGSKRRQRPVRRNRRREPAAANIRPRSAVGLRVERLSPSSDVHRT
jgi:hypothetical protein